MDRVLRYIRYIRNALPSLTSVGKGQDERIAELQQQVEAKQTEVEQIEKQLVKKHEEQRLRGKLGELNAKHKEVRGKLHGLQFRQALKLTALVGLGVVVLLIIIAVAGKC